MAVDVSGLAALSADLAAGAAAVAREARQVVSRGALNIKRDWRSNAAASGRQHARRYPSTIGYDLLPLPGGGTEAVVGPDRELLARQGSLDQILEYGSVHNAPHNDGGRALDAEEPRFLAAAEALAARALR